ncbi:recQ-mediated genome instability protein 1 [Elaeis guineensis]|uniref:RecQ-mediated genome instability protein 1 n=1 Tax=Elaeis guineensis var. tenera TaxID=51953 RepID=A0A8N4F0A5_ELAGV|nr:recQ-mediated genome instability protein 1 [Elaeis guineensis]
MRRRLRLPSSSDEEDDDKRPQTLTSLNPNSNPSPDPPPAPPNPPLEISDDDFVDVPDDLSPLSPPTAPAHPAGTPMDNDGASSVPRPGLDGSLWPIDEFLRRLGLWLRPEWLGSCVASLTGSGSGFEGLDVAGKARRCFEHFLLSDMNRSGAGVLPENVHGMHRAELEGPFVLQVDEIINISAPLRERYHDAPAGFKRCLKLSMTDGVQRIFGMEYRPIRELEVLAPAGFKIIIRNVHIRRGLLMLVPEVLEVLGGQVDDLEAARQRLVGEVNKPPRSKRKQCGLPLSRRASLAAWPSDAINNGAQANIPISQNVNNPQQLAQAVNLASSENVAGGTIFEECVVPQNARNNSEEFTSRHVGVTAEEQFAASHVGGNITEEPISANNRPDTEPNLSSGAASDEEISHASDTGDAVGEVEHPLILSGEREIPFTYLASLLAKWTTQKDNIPFIQGKIKCFLTGVKGFQFKQRSAFELHVYVDDGSLISEVLLDHNVVQNGIGHSPEEVTAALSSSDKKKVTDMRETMKKFQLLLAKFEGTMLVEINGNSPLPVVLEMNQNCSTSDAWLLLQRLKKFTVPQNQQHNNLKSIDLSP